MSKPVIAVDIDEVLFPLAPTLLDFQNAQYGTAFGLDELTSYYIEDLTGETREVTLRKISEYLQSEHYDAGKPIKGSVDAIHALRKHFNLVLITSRQPMYRGKTEKFIEDHFGGLFDELRYTHTKEQPDVTVSKHKICDALGAKILIDDSPHNVADASKAGIKCILFGDYPWNQVDRLPEGATRCKDWPAVLEHLNV